MASEKCKLDDVKPNDYPESEMNQGTISSDKDDNKELLSSEEVNSDKYTTGLKLFDECKYNEALAIFTDIYKEKISELGPNHVDSIKIQILICAVHRMENRLEEAYDIYRDMKCKISDLKQPDAEEILELIAPVLLDEGEYDELYNLYENLEGGTELQIRIADKLSDIRDFYEAEQIHRKIYKRRLYSLGPFHDQTHNSIRAIADLLIKQKKDKEAWKISDKMIDYGTKYQMETALLFFRRKKYKRALHVLKRLYRKELKMSDAEDPETSLIFKHLIAKMYIFLKKYRKAQQMLREIIESKLKSLDIFPEHFAHVVSNFETLIFKIRNWEQGYYFLHRILEEVKAIKGEDNEQAKHLLSILKYVTINEIQDIGEVQDTERYFIVSDN